MPVQQPSNATFYGLTAAFDTRVHAVRDDVADIALTGMVDVPRFVQPVPMHCKEPWIAVQDANSKCANQISELLDGETFMVVDQKDGWAWGYCAHDHYVGYLPANCLGPWTYDPVIASADPIETARSFLGMTYVWGGRGGAGIDCSGLIQRSLATIGVFAQRDSDMQRATLGSELPTDEAVQARDLIFFPGHVGMMIDNVDMIHATRHFGKVVIEPLSDVVARVSEKHQNPIIARKRVTL